MYLQNVKKLFFERHYKYKLYYRYDDYNCYEIFQKFFNRLAVEATTMNFFAQLQCTVCDYVHGHRTLIEKPLSAILYCVSVVDDRITHCG